MSIDFSQREWVWMQYLEYEVYKGVLEKHGIESAKELNAVLTHYEQLKKTIARKDKLIQAWGRKR